MTKETTAAMDMTEQPTRLSDGSYEPMLTNKDLMKCGWRWMIASLTYNYASQQACSVVLAEQEALRKVYRGDEAGYKASLANCFKYFNITPHMGGLLLGAGLAISTLRYFFPGI